MHLLFLWVFSRPKIVRPMEGNSCFLGLIAKVNSSYNIHVRHFTFGQCIVYTVSNKKSLFKKFILLFINIKKKVFLLKN